MKTPRSLISLAFLCLATLITTTAFVRARNSIHVEANSPPTAVDDSYSLHSDHNKKYLLNVLTNDSDPDGDQLLLSINTLPQHGELTLTSTFEYRPEAGYNGDDVFTYKVCDTHDACSFATVNIQLANATPVAGNDSYDVHRFTLIGPFFANDSDPDGDPLSLNALVVTPAHGSLTNGPTPDTYNYRADLGYTGADSFTYRVCDNQGACTTANVSVNVINEPPTVSNKTFLIRGNTIVRPLQGDADPESDPFLLSFVTTPQHGGLFNTSTTAVYEFRPAAGFTGSDSFIYKACDDLKACSTATVTLLIIGDGENNGACSPCDTGGAISVGQPVNVTNGNMYVQQTDYQLPSLGFPIEVARTYNSDSARVGLFGRGWSTAYDESIITYDDSLWRFNQGDGRAIYFGRPVGTSVPFVPIEGDFHGQISQNGTNYTITTKGGSVRQFNQAGKLVSRTDRMGNQTTLTYNGAGRVSTITDPFNRVLTLVTNTAGQVISISDAMGTIATYAYSGNRLASVTYADNSSFRFTYHSSLKLAEVIDALGNVLESHSYDGQGRAITSLKHGGVDQYTLSYVSSSQTDVTDGLGRVTKYTIDKSKGRNVVTRVEGLCNCGGSPGSQVTTRTYDALLNVTSKTDALGQVTSYTYDTDGNRLTETDASGTVSYTYNEFAQMLTRTNQLNGVTTNTFDSSGNLISIRDALESNTTFTYNGRGQLLTATDARGKVSTFTYDNVGNLTQNKDANNITSFFFYDARGRLTKVRDALSRNTQFSYDSAGRTNKITHPDNSFVSFTYDLAGRRTVLTDQRGNATTYAYDPAYRVTNVTDALNNSTTFSHDAMSNLASTTDTLARTTNYEYDAFNRLVKVIYPPATSGANRLFATMTYDAGGKITQRTDTAGRSSTYAYDNLGRITNSIDANNKTTSFEYDALSRTTALTDALNQRYEFAYDALGRQTNVSRGGVVMTYEYDAVGNRTKRKDYNGAITNYVYDNLSRLTSINYPARTATYGYTAMGQLSRATNENGSVYIGYDNRYRVSSFSDPFYYGISYNYDAAGNRTKLSLNGAAYATYSYDAVNRLTNLKDSANLNFPHSYDAANRLTSRSAPNGVTTNLDYDGLDRLVSLTHVAGQNTLLANHYTYNDANNISTWDNASGNHAYAYDSLDRLISANSVQVNENYGYDGVGNRISSHLSPSYNYQPFNKLAGTATASYTYDNNGNLTSRTDSLGTSLFSWNEENQLTKVSLPGGLTVDYKYDALGRRIERTTSAGESERYVYDGHEVLLDLNADWSVANKYLNDLGMDNHLRQTSAVHGVSYFLTDHLGSTSALTDSAGNIQEHLTYDSFGNSGGSTRTRYDYTGREHDPDTRLMYYRARFYDPQVGRFISEDPIAFAGGINQLSYAGNNPQNVIDPSGLYGIDVHYYLTYFLARSTGCFTDAQARLIGEFDQLTDDDDDHAPGALRRKRNVAFHSLGTRDQNAARLKQLWGIASQGNGSLSNLGIFFHFLQDSYAHRDFAGNENWGHASAGYSPDHTNSNPAKAMMMARDTWEHLRKFAENRLCCKANEPNWSTVSAFMDVGYDLSTKEGRRKDFALEISDADLRSKIKILDVAWRSFDGRSRP